MKEQWKDIEGYEGIYQVSNYGNVRSLDRTTLVNNGIASYKGRILSPFQNHNGYLIVSLSKEGKVKDFRIHRLVAKHFLSNYSNELQVNHKDGNRKNNHFENLEMVTCQENIWHKNHILRKESSSNKPMKVLDKASNQELTFDSRKECAEYYHISRLTLTKNLSGKQKSRHFIILES